MSTHLDNGDDPDFLTGSLLLIFTVWALFMILAYLLEVLD